MTTTRLLAMTFAWAVPFVLTLTGPLQGSNDYSPGTLQRPVARSATTPPPTVIIPEPATLLFTAAAGIGLFRRRRGHAAHD
jgi:hypothetical protein